MKYDHMVKVNGTYYAAGEEVPDIKAARGENPLPFLDNDTDSEKSEYTKTDINGMKTAELQELAAKEGIEGAYETSGSELKKILAEHFGL